LIVSHVDAEDLSELGGGISSSRCGEGIEQLLDLLPVDVLA
jgi:hypothetical protein